MEGHLRSSFTSESWKSHHNVLNSVGLKNHKKHFWKTWDDMMLFLTCLFQRKSRAIVISVSSLLFLCKNFNVAHYSESIEGIRTPNLEYFLIMTRCSCKTRGITLTAIFLELCPFLTKNFKKNDGPWQTSIGTACGALDFLLENNMKTYCRITESTEVCCC